MVGIGGQIAPYIGNPSADTIVTSGATFSGITNFPGGILVSGGTNLQNVSGFFWRGVHTSGITGLLSGVSCKGFMRMEMSGQGVYVAYWVSA